MLDAGRAEFILRDAGSCGIFAFPFAMIFAIAGRPVLRCAVPVLVSTATRRRLFWTLQIGTWSALIPLFIWVNLLIGTELPVALFNGIVRQSIGFSLTLGLALIYRRWQWATFSLRRHGLIVALLSVAATLVDAVLCEMIRVPVQQLLGMAPPVELQLASSVFRVCIYASWSVLYLVLSFFFELHNRDLRLAQAEVTARDAELQVLRAQLNPHFLFNALNAILAEAEDNPARVKAITLNLSELLRFSLRQREHFGPLGAEIAAIENYLRVESARFEARLDWRVEISPAAREALVPTSLLISLVENAIKYGLQTSPGRLEVRIAAEVRAGSIDAFVQNTGRWVEPDPTAMRSTGIGLANLRRRLALLCGAAARVDVSFPPGLVRVDLHVPIAEKFA